jgi:hypothetical protein
VSGAMGAKRDVRSCAARPLALAVWVAAQCAVAGPVLVYREGAAFCPKDRPATAPRITAVEAAERAKALMPKDFCGPDAWVDGCDYDAEFALNSWRIYVRQWKQLDGRKQYEPRDHSFVVLDPIGNCLANIPGT